MLYGAAFPFGRFMSAVLAVSQLFAHYHMAKNAFVSELSSKSGELWYHFIIWQILLVLNIFINLFLWFDPLIWKKKE